MYDISHYEIVPDFSKISPTPVLIITKATEGTSYYDPTFVDYMTRMKDTSIRRGAYHFHRKAYSATSQVANFVNACKRALVTPDDILVLDVEEGGETAQQLMDFLVLLRGEYPDNLLMIYSRKNILDPIPTLRNRMPMFDCHPLDAIQTTQAQRDFFKTIPVWTAGYPYLPDLYSSPPASYIPDQTRWGPVWAWQYSDQGIVSGIQGEVDVNWVSPELLQWLTGAPNTDVVEHYCDGRVKVTHGHRSAPRVHNFHIAEFKHTDIDFIEVTGPGFSRTGSSYFESRKEKFGRPPDIIKQGDESYDGRTVKGLGVSMGNLYKADSDETNVQWDKDNNIIGVSMKVLPGVYNATGGSNWLCDKGAIHWSTLDEPNIPDPRSGIGWNDTYLKFGIIDGRNDGTLGLGKSEFAQFFLDWDCPDAHNSDGGDSNLLGVNVDGKLKILNNLPEGVEKQLPQYIGIWLKEINTMPSPVPDPDGKTYEFTVAKNIALRSETEAQEGHVPPSMFSTGLRTIVPGVYRTDRPTFLNEGVTWVHYFDDEGEGALPMEWNNVTYVKNFHEVDTTPPPPVLEPVKVTIQLFDDDGNETYEPQTVVMMPKVQP